MDTKDTAKTTAPSVAQAKPTLKPKPAGEPEPEDPVPSVPSIELQDDSLGSWGAASVDCMCRQLMTRQGRRRQGEEEPKTSVKASMNDQKMYSPTRPH